MSQPRFQKGFVQVTYRHLLGRLLQEMNCAAAADAVYKAAGLHLPSDALLGAHHPYWQKVGNTGADATQLLDIITSDPWGFGRESHVSVIVTLKPQRLALSSSLIQGVQCDSIGTIPKVCGVYRLTPAAAKRFRGPPVLVRRVPVKIDVVLPGWIETHAEGARKIVAKYTPLAVPVTSLGCGQLGLHFSNSLLENVKVAFVSEFPPSPLCTRPEDQEIERRQRTACGLAAQCAGLLILVHETWRNSPGLESVLFHELVHAAQNLALGPDRMHRINAMAFQVYGDHNPTEVLAYDLQYRFECDSLAGSVMAEIEADARLIWERIEVILRGQAQLSQAARYAASRGLMPTPHKEPDASEALSARIPPPKYRPWELGGSGPKP